MEGMAEESRQAKKHGARLHPRSGAGSIKWDASNDEVLFEMKNALKSHTLQGEYLKRLALDAARQGKEARYLVTFENAGIEIECRVNLRGKP